MGSRSLRLFVKESTFLLLVSKTHQNYSFFFFYLNLNLLMNFEFGILDFSGVSKRAIGDGEEGCYGGS